MDDIFMVTNSSEWDGVGCSCCTDEIEGDVLQNTVTQETFCKDCAPKALNDAVREIMDAATEMGVRDEMEWN